MTGTQSSSRPTEVAMTTREIWEEELGAEISDPTADFLDLGGHSLVAMRITARTREAFGLTIPASFMFRFPTLESFTHAVNAALSEAETEAGDTAGTLHGLFEQQAAAGPNAVAVTAADVRLTYRELDARADAVAHTLQASGVAAESVVPVLVDRSAAMPVALLGVMKAGGAVLPLSPDEPRLRLEHILSQVRPHVVLAEPHLAERLPDGLRIVPLPEAASTGPAHPHARANGAVSGNLAYVVYTSGSTGNPKGVCLEHASLANLFLWYREAVEPGAQILQFAPFSFDVSLHEMISAFAAGGTLHVIDRGPGIDPAELADFIERKGITRVVLPPVAIQVLADAAVDSSVLASLRTLVSTGDSLHLTPAVSRLMGSLPHCTLLNHYGATESQGGTVHTFDSPWSDAVGAAPLGEPVRGVGVHLLNRALEPVPPGGTGELYFTGIGHARGYLGQPALTAERFIPDHLSDEPGARAYRTGDRVSRAEGSRLEFVGRTDLQVKIRGFRVETAEVERALERSGVPKHAAVVARPDAQGQTALVAYVVPAVITADPASELHEFLAERLPSYMVPSTFVVLDSMPLSPNGKIDRAALPHPADVRPQPRSGSQAPQTGTEHVLAGIWSELLQREYIGADEDFFELGGDSIKAILMVSRCREVAGLDVSIRQVFDAPTIAALATVIDAAGERSIRP